MNVLLSLNFIAFLGVTVYAVYLFVYLIRTRISYIRLGQKEDFDKRTKERLQKIWENVFGQKKLLKDKKSGIIHVAYRDGTSEQIQFIPERGYYNELLNFYNALTAQEPILSTPEAAYGDLKMVFDAIKSIENNQPVRVDDIYYELKI